MRADAEVEAFLARVLDQVLVGADACRLEGLGAQLLILVGDEVDAEGEVVDVGALAAEIKDADFGVGNATVKPGLGERLRERRRQSITIPGKRWVAAPCAPPWSSGGKISRQNLTLFLQ